MKRAERWREIPEWEGLYEMNRRGRVRRIGTGRLLQPNVYGAITLSRGGARAVRGLGKLYWQTWGEAPPWGQIAELAPKGWSPRGGR